MLETCGHAPFLSRPPISGPKSFELVGRPLGIQIQRSGEEAVRREIAEKGNQNLKI